MSKIKKSVSLALALLMLIGVFAVAPITASAIIETSGDYEYVIRQEGIAEIYKYNGTDSDLIIPSELDGNTVVLLDDYSFQNNDNIESVTIPDTVTSVGVYVFSGCPNLKAVAFSNALESLGQGMFCDCTSLTSVALPDNIKTIEGYVFKNCSSLFSFTANNISEIENGAFSGCTSLESFTFPEEVTIVSDEVFYNCTNLASVNLSSNTTYIYDCAFENCEALNSLTIPGKVEYIGALALKNCTSLTSITIPKSVKSVDEKAFYGCTKLATIKQYNTITELGNKVFDKTAYYNNSKNWSGNGLFVGKYLVSVKSSATTLKVKSGTLYMADSVCDRYTKLKSVVFADSVTSISSEAFMNCKNLTSVQFGKDLKVIQSNAFTNSGVKKCYIPKNVKSIYEGSIGCKYITNTDEPYYKALKGAVLYCVKGTTAAKTCASYKKDCGVSYKYVTMKNAAVNIGKSKTVKPTAGKVKSYATSNKKIAKVSKSGKVTGIRRGKVKITATLTDGCNIKCTVVVR